MNGETLCFSSSIANNFYLQYANLILRKYPVTRIFSHNFCVIGFHISPCFWFFSICCLLKLILPWILLKVLTKSKRIKNMPKLPAFYKLLMSDEQITVFKEWIVDYNLISDHIARYYNIFIIFFRKVFYLPSLVICRFGKTLSNDISGCESE